jgi:hypothetical protein
MPNRGERPRFFRASALAKAKPKKRVGARRKTIAIKSKSAQRKRKKSANLCISSLPNRKPGSGAKALGRGKARVLSRICIYI